MKSRLLLLFLLFVLAGILGPERLSLSSAATLLSWSVDDERSLAAHEDAASLPPLVLRHDRAVRIEARGRNRGGITSMQLSGVGTFRCRARSGVMAPFEVVVPLETVSGELRTRRGDALPTSAAATQAIELRRISCGRHLLPGHSEPEELFAVSGTAVLHASLDDLSGGRRAASLTLELY